ncbi:MAG: VCBS repeat-containing protein, partial [Bacteroidota bacterium]|nr:VCBS repeat-containing protein [Bacteroidota bacterium]
QDGLQDVFISGNMTANKLFLNKGHLQYEDVSRQAGIRGNGTWSTGVSIADVNGDGLPDIYVCHSGKYPADKLVNELFINTGNEKGAPRFIESAKEYGLDAPGTQSTQAAFVDYDKDGDLDMFLLNHSVHTYYALVNTTKQRTTPDFRYGNRLFRNDTPLSTAENKKTSVPTFTDVTLKAGIVNNPLNYGLSVNVSDVNQDGWPDIYTTSDYTEHDCYYVNNRDGTFTQSLQRSFAHISKFSMGADIADYNNDGLPDVLTLDMLPEDNHRQKLLKGPDQYDQYHLLLDSGYYRQHMRNMLHLNRGKDAKGNARFSEIGQLAGISNTDWSWAGLMADFDGDGWKDILITNGYLRDFTDLDFLKYTMADAQLAAVAQGNQDFKNYELVRKMPSNKLRNYVFRNNRDLTFENVSEPWGFDALSISNAAAYADLDNDGDMDLVIGNNNEPVMLYRNNSTRHHWLNINLEGKAPNTAALGAKLWLYAGDDVQYLEQFPVRGFQSTVTPVLQFNFASEMIDSIKIEWPSGSITVLRQPAIDQPLTVREENASTRNNSAAMRATLFADAPHSADFRHSENDFIDFRGEVLLPYQLSRMGPALAKADVNGDGNDDFYIGGAIGQPGELFLQAPDGSFVPSARKPWKEDFQSEDVNALFFDADNDGDADLYVVSGGNEYEDQSIEYQDRLYINDGEGNFARATEALPAMRSNKQAVAAGDFDLDGDLDLFIGGRGKPGAFPLPSPSYILRNDSKDGNVLFRDVTAEICPALQSAGMVTVASWSDFDGDKAPELLLAGDWMPIMLFKNKGGVLQDISARADLSGTHGQWSAVLVQDLDGDGDKDIVMGNSGLNLQFKPTVKEPMAIHLADFDNNGAMDPIISYYIQGKNYPMASRDQLLDQIPQFKKKYIRYTDYADASLDNVFESAALRKAKSFQCVESKTIILLNDNNLSFRRGNLPLEVQFSATNSILSDDYDGDGIIDLIMFGNFFPYRPELGESDASMGLFLKGAGDAIFNAVPPGTSGLFADGDVRRAVQLKNTSGRRKLVVSKNDDLVQVIQIGDR